MEAVADRFYKDGDICLDGGLYIQEYVQERAHAGDDWEINALDLIPGHDAAKFYAVGDVPLEIYSPTFIIQMIRDADGFAFDLLAKYQNDNEFELKSRLSGKQSGVKTIRQGVRKLIHFANYLSPKPVLRA